MEEESLMSNALSSFHALGISGYPLLFCVLVLITIIFERLFFLFIANRPVNLKIDASRISTRQTVLYALVHELTSIKSLSKNNRDEIMSISFTLAKRQLKMGLGMLKFIAAIAPMFGILGNVLGMVSSFTVISQGNGTINPAMVSGGLKEAMYATSTGLMVAMPAMFFEYFFDFVASSRIDNYFNYINRLNVKIEIANQTKAGQKLNIKTSGIQTQTAKTQLQSSQSQNDQSYIQEMRRQMQQQQTSEDSNTSSQNRNNPPKSPTGGLSKKLQNNDY